MSGGVPERIAWSSPREVLWAEWWKWWVPHQARLLGGKRMLWILLGCVALYVAAMEATVGSIDPRSLLVLLAAFPWLVFVSSLWELWLHVRVRGWHRLPPIEPGWSVTRETRAARVTTGLDDFDGYRVEPHPLVPQHMVVDLHTRHGWWSHRYVLPASDPRPMEAIRRWLPERLVAADEADPAAEFLRQFDLSDEPSVGELLRRALAPVTRKTGGQR